MCRACFISTPAAQGTEGEQQQHHHNMHPEQKGTIVRTPLHPAISEKLDPAFVKLYNDHIANGPPQSLDISVVRANYSAMYAYATAPPTGVGGIGETHVPGWEKYPGEINVRVYVPPGEEPGERRIWPVHFNFHGGGWVVGDLETDAHICHHICASVPCCVIDVEYRLIPEYPFPIGIMDSISAVAHILANHQCFSIDPNNVTLGGESAGATIALILSHKFRDSGLSEKLKGVICGTPTISDVRKYASPSQSPWPSMRESEFAPLLNWDKLKWFDSFKWMSLSSNHPGPPPTAGGPPSRTHSRQEQQKDMSWYANALTAPDFKNLAPLTWIGTAEVDPLRDEAEAYAEKLRENGNNVILRRFPGVPHAFMHMDKVLPQGREYVQDVIRHVRSCLYPPQLPTPEESTASSVEAPTVGPST